MSTSVDADYKVCTACGQDLPLSDYYENNGRAASSCKECFKKRSRDQKARNRENIFKDVPRSRSPPRTPESSEDNADSLYIMSNPLIPGIVKIGRAGCPETRARNLSSSQPFRVKVEYVYKGMGFIERKIHARLSAANVQGGQGREWFYISPHQANAVIVGSLVEFECNSAAITQAQQAQTSTHSQELIDQIEKLAWPQ